MVDEERLEAKPGDVVRPGVDAVDSLMGILGPVLGSSRQNFGLEKGAYGLSDSLALLAAPVMED